MLRLDQDGYTSRLQRGFDGVGDLGGQRFLGLEPPGENLNNPGDL